MCPVSTSTVPSPPSAKWVWIGLAACLVLVTVNVSAGFAGGVRVGANIAGTLALAPTLTGIGGSARQVSVIGVVATTLSYLVARSDGATTGVVIISCSVVAVVSAVVAGIARARQGALAQLQDRRQAARALQAAMLTELPRSPGLDLAARYLPASAGDQVGGDWYDAIIGRDGSTTLVIGDVTGHDVNAAALMGQIRAMMRAFASEGVPSPAGLLHRTEQAMATLGIDTVASAVVVTVSPDATSDSTTDPEGSRGPGARTLTWSSAGHPPPLLVSQEHQGRVSASPLLGGAGGSPATDHSDCTDLLLGVLPGTTRRDHVDVLPPRGALLLYTDGLVERRDEALDVSIAKLGAVVSEQSSESVDALLEGALAKMLVHQNGDDVAVIAVQLEASR